MSDERMNLFEAIASVNNTMREFGFTEKIVIGNDNIEVSEKEVIIKMPYILKLTIARQAFESQEKGVIKDAVNQAISRAISSPVSREK